MGHRMLRYLKEVREGGCKVVAEADDPSLLPLHLFAGVSAVPCRTFDVVSGEPLEFSLSQWLTDGWYKTHALVLHGDAGLGKTPLAMAMLAEVASILQVDCQWRPYHLKGGTVEALREAVNVGMVKAFVPILFDDLTPAEAAGVTGKTGLPLESLKLLLEVQQSSTLQARLKDLCFQPNTPRVFTSNAVNPSEFHKGLPPDPWGMSAVARRGLCSNVKAAFKRCCFAHVARLLVPDDARASHNKHRRVGDMVDA